MVAPIEGFIVPPPPPPPDEGDESEDAVGVADTWVDVAILVPNVSLGVITK